MSDDYDFDQPVPVSPRRGIDLLNLGDTLSTMNLTRHNKVQEMQDHLLEVKASFHRTQTAHCSLFERYQQVKNYGGLKAFDFYTSETVEETMYGGMFPTLEKQLELAEKELLGGDLNGCFICLSIVEEFVGPIWKEVQVLGQAMKELEIAAMEG